MLLDIRPEILHNRDNICYLLVIQIRGSGLGSRKACHPQMAILSLQWRHNDHDSVSNHQPHGCLLNRLFRRRSKETSKLLVTGLCAGNLPDRWIPRTKGPVTRKMFPFDDVNMISIYCWTRSQPMRGDIIYVTSSLIGWGFAQSRGWGLGDFLRWWPPSTRWAGPSIYLWPPPRMSE